MITLEGEIQIRTISGRFGLFNVGQLTTSIGCFSVKDEVIEEMEEGSFKGLFTVSYIDQGHFSIGSGNRVTVEVRARLASMELFSNDPDGPLLPDYTNEQDPLEIESSLPLVSPVDYASVTEVVHDQDPSALFGSLWPFVEDNQVTLDPTVERAQLRLQAQWLKGNGYRYRPAERVWFKEV